MRGTRTRVWSCLAVAVIGCLVAGCGAQQTTIELPGNFVAQDYAEGPYGFYGGSVGGYTDLYLKSPKTFLGRGEGGAHFYAISEDGSSAVWFHTFYRGGGSEPEGVYRYTPDGGVEFLHESAKLVPESGHSATLPDNLIAFVDTEVDPDLRTWAISGDGQEFPLALVGVSRLHRAAYDDDGSQVRALVAEGEPVDVASYWGHTPLELAIANGSRVSALALIESGASLDLSECSAEYLAALYQRTGILEDLCRIGAERGRLSWEEEPLFFAAVSLVEVPHDWSTIGSSDEMSYGTVLGWSDPASERGVEVVEVLTRLGVNPSIWGGSGRGRPPMLEAVRTGQSPNVIRALCEAGCEPDEGVAGHTVYRSTPLHKAIELNRGVATVEALLQCGADPNRAISDKGETVLQYAADACARILTRGAPYLVPLLAGGADPDKRDENGRTALHYLRDPQDSKEVMLKSHFVDAPPDDPDYSAIRTLVSRSSEIDARDGDGVTPLQRAVWRGHEGVARLLVKAGADGTLPCYAGSGEFLESTVLECLKEREREQ